MAKQRRPRGPRAIPEPNPAPAQTTGSALESPTLESSPPAAGPAIESPIDGPTAPFPALDADAIEVGEIAAEEASPTVASPAQSVTVVPDAPLVIGAHADAEAIPPGELESVGPSAPYAPARPSTGFEMSFSPERIDIAGIGETITGYMRGEGAAAAAHMRALGRARSPADMIRLQVGEFQRAADASLTCWSQVARKASRAFAYR